MNVKSEALFRPKKVYFRKIKHFFKTYVVLAAPESTTKVNIITHETDHTHILLIEKQSQYKLV